MANPGDRVKTDGYTCSNCHQWFEYEEGWTDDDAFAEAEANGFDLSDDMAVVCDDCYRGMGVLQAMLPEGALRI